MFFPPYFPDFTPEEKASISQSISPSVEDQPKSKLVPLSEETKKWVVSHFQDLTEEIEKGIVQPTKCIGREDTISLIAANLASRHPAVLVSGPPGVGKSFLINELARKVLQNEIRGLEGWRVLVPTDPQILAGANTLIQCARLVPKSIIVLDEAHRYFRPGIWDMMTNPYAEQNSGGSFAEDLKPFLANGDIHLLCFSDRARFTSDLALRRRFFSIDLPELTIETTEKILKMEKSQFEKSLSKQFNATVSVDDDAILLGLKLAMAYYPNEYFPAKGWRLLEPACVWTCGQHKAGQTIHIRSEQIFTYIQSAFKKSRSQIMEDLRYVEQARISQISPTDPLGRCTTNLTIQAKLGLLGPVFGRDKEIEDVAKILGGLENNNVILTGQPGVGKSRIAEGLAYAIHQGKFPYLAGKEVLLLNWSSIKDGKVSISSLLESAERLKGQFILIIDEFHQLANANPVGNLDFSSLLKGGGNIGQTLNTIEQSLGSIEQFKEIWARGGMPTLAISTEKEISGIMANEAISQRFIPITISSFSPRQAIEVIKREIGSLVQKYKTDYHNPLTITDDAIEAAVYLALHYFPSEALPRSAFKLLHPTCSLLYRQATSREDALSLTGMAIIKHAANFYGGSVEEVQAHLREQQANDHPSNYIIPTHSPIRLYSDNLTNEARLGKIPQMRGREQELQNIIQTLGKPSCNNILIVSPPGTGKTTLVKQLAVKMANGEVPIYLQNKLLLSLRVSEITNEVEKFNNLIKDINKHAGKFVLFIDEIHILFQLGPLILNQLKPLLADGKVSLIGATTPEDLKKFVDLKEADPSLVSKESHPDVSHMLSMLGVSNLVPFKDPALLRRFQILNIGAPSEVEAVEMIQAAKPLIEKEIEKKWGTAPAISSGAIGAAVKQAACLTQEHLPASAIKIIEEASISTLREGGNTLEERHITAKMAPPRAKDHSLKGILAALFAKVAALFSRVGNLSIYIKARTVRWLIRG